MSFRYKTTPTDKIKFKYYKLADNIIYAKILPRSTRVSELPTICLKIEESEASSYLIYINDELITDLDSELSTFSQNFTVRFENISPESLKAKNEKLRDDLSKKTKDLDQIMAKEKAQEKEISDLKDEIKKMKKLISLHPTSEVKLKLLDDKDIESLDIVEEIGYGGGGKVYKVAAKTYYALKEMNAKSATTEKLREYMKDYEVMAMLNHPFIVNAYGISLSSSKKPPMILLEFCAKNLEQLIGEKSLSKVAVICVIYQIAEGMKYIHFNKIIHRDLKPTNILIAEDGTVKISDFRVSALISVEEQSLTRGTGTMKFMAPEIINEDEEYSEKVDVYSFGILVFYILTGGELP